MVLAFRGVYPLLLFDCETVVTLAVSVELSDVPAVTASETAEMLGVSTACVTQLCRDGSLNSWRVGSARTVSRDSIGCPPHCQARGGKATQSLRRSVKMRLTRLTGRC